MTAADSTQGSNGSGRRGRGAQGDRCVLLGAHNRARADRQQGSSTHETRWARADRQQGSSTHETRCVACPQYRARDPQVRSAGVPLPARGLSIGCALQAAPRRCRSMVQRSERRRPTVQSSQRRSTRVGRCRPVAWPRQALSYSDVSRTRERAHGRADEQIALES